MAQVVTSSQPSSVKKITFIINPFSGTSDKSSFAQLIDKHLDHSLWTPTLQYTAREGHGIELAHQAMNDGADVIVAVGGDGSVNEVASALVGSKTTLGIIPQGSGNGFGMHLGISRNATKALAVINEGYSTLIDTCYARDRFFLNVAGLGFDGKVVSESKGQKKRGFQLYLLAALRGARDFTASEMQITLDGKTWSGVYMAAVVANASMYGFNFTIAPTASLQDGLFDLVLIKDAHRLKYLLESYRFFNRSAHKSPLIEIHRAASISIQTSRKEYIHVDGEPYNISGNIDFRMNPKSLNVMVPRPKNNQRAL